MKDIIVSFGNNNNFYCVCIGIGYLGYKDLVVSYVLGKLVL